MTPGPITAVLFDLDDTLLQQADSDRAALLATIHTLPAAVQPAHAEALCQAVTRQAQAAWLASPYAEYTERIGISAGEGLWARFLGDHPALRGLRGWAPGFRREVWQAALADLGPHAPRVDTGACDRLASCFARERRARHVLWPDALVTLRRLRGTMRLGLVTNGAPCLQREKLAASGLAPLFDSVVISGDLDVGKPHPAPFEQALRDLQSSPDQTAMVGDNPLRDIAGAQRARLALSIWVRRGPHPAVSSITPDLAIESLTYLPALLHSHRRPSA
jgi:putative hydrolase of the HAD superfamily